MPASQAGRRGFEPRLPLQTADQPQTRGTVNCWPLRSDRRLAAESSRYRASTEGTGWHVPETPNWYAGVPAAKLLLTTTSPNDSSTAGKMSVWIGQGGSSAEVTRITGLRKRKNRSECWDTPTAIKKRGPLARATRGWKNSFSQIRVQFRLNPNPSSEGEPHGSRQ
jgi:hypothetical protein